jgi:hypothetical protein
MIMTKKPKTIADKLRQRKSTPKAKSTKSADWYSKAHARLAISKNSGVSEPENRH